MKPHIFAEVFGYLDKRSNGRAAQVCWTWRGMAYVSPIRREIEVTCMSPVGLVDSYIRRGIRRLRQRSSLYWRAMVNQLGQFLYRRNTRHCGNKPSSGWCNEQQAQ